MTAATVDDPWNGQACPLCGKSALGCDHSEQEIRDAVLEASAEMLAALIPEPVRLSLPEDHAARKAIPITSGCLDYFPAALAAVAELSRIGNEQHNKGEPMHHARGKSNDHADCIVRHLLDRGHAYEVVINGVKHKVRHSVAVAWRALALAQEELEREEGAPLARGAKAAP
jgi:hypothetical protein